mmetsp:Transcript_30557/g.73319  ORF Transcript_30557/g.73319 Transcript_30557/m.73319 type:complete len:201 (+) Transcript_30557:420-1022(+)
MLAGMEKQCQELPETAIALAKNPNSLVPDAVHSHPPLVDMAGLGIVDWLHQRQRICYLCKHPEVNSLGTPMFERTDCIACDGFAGIVVAPFVFAVWNSQWRQDSYPFGYYHSSLDPGTSSSVIGRNGMCCWMKSFLPRGMPKQWTWSLIQEGSHLIPPESAHTCVTIGLVHLAQPQTFPTPILCGTFPFHKLMWWCCLQR